MSFATEELERKRVLDALQQHKARGHHVDERLLKEIQAPGTVRLLNLTEPSDFLKLVWQSNSDCRPLAPRSQPRTLADCARRLDRYGWSFQQLVESGYRWFRVCAEIDNAFDYERFGWVALTPLLPGEREETPGGTYYIYDGVHKSIVLAKKLLRREIPFRPIETLLLEPRRY